VFVGRVSGSGIALVCVLGKKGPKNKTTLPLAIFLKSTQGPYFWQFWCNKNGIVVQLLFTKRTLS
jgi:hypothetical protein